MSFEIDLLVIGVSCVRDQTSHQHVQRSHRTQWIVSQVDRRAVDGIGHERMARAQAREDVSRVDRCVSRQGVESDGLHRGRLVVSEVTERHVSPVDPQEGETGVVEWTRR